jgi:regulator of replication initiation timing
MFEKTQSRIGNLEYETAQLKAELAKVRAELAEVKRKFSRLTEENAGLRAENDRLIKLGLAPAYPVTKRHQWPKDYDAEEETRPDGL